MQYLTRGFLLAGLLALIGCSLFETDDEKKPPVETFFTAQFNGQRWEAEPDAYLECLSTENTGETSTLQLVGTYSAPNSYWFEELYLPVPFPGSQSYSLTREKGERHGSLFIEGESDAAVAPYYPTDDSSVNRMEITSYDPESGVMEGTFRTTLVVDENDLDDPMRRQPDTLRFTEGRFRVEVEDHRDVTGGCE